MSQIEQSANYGTTKLNYVVIKINVTRPEQYVQNLCQINSEKHLWTTSYSCDWNFQVLHRNNKKQLFMIYDNLNNQPV